MQSSQFEKTHKCSMIASGKRFWNISLGFYVVKPDLSTISCMIILLVNDLLHVIAKIHVGGQSQSWPILWVKINKLRKQHLQNSLGFHFLRWNTKLGWLLYFLLAWSEIFLARVCTFYCSRFFYKTDQSYGSPLQNFNLIPIEYL